AMTLAPHDLTLVSRCVGHPHGTQTVFPPLTSRARASAAAYRNWYGRPSLSHGVELRAVKPIKCRAWRSVQGVLAQAHVEGDHDTRSADNILCIVAKRPQRRPAQRANHRPASRRHEMGKRVVASDELELYTLRKRFLAVSEQIAGLLAELVQRIRDAPPATQASLLASAGHIAAAQQRLRNETDRLAGRPAECAAILQIALQAQLAASCQLANILRTNQGLSHLDTRLANIAQALAQPRRPEPRPTTWEPVTRGGEHDDLSIAEA